MPSKWTEPKPPTPSWLGEEVTERPAPMTREEFTASCVDILRSLGIPLWQAFEITANSINETGGDGRYRGNNLGGWKITKGYAQAYLTKHGKKPPFWAAPGNKAKGATLSDFKGGDGPWCYYRVFDSAAHYLAEWAAKFTPKPDPSWSAEFIAELERKRETTADYRLTGYLFWNDRPEWFVAMCDAGYKGANTDANPLPSFREHCSVVGGVRVTWAQAKLRAWQIARGHAEPIKVDRQWGPKSAAAARAFQAAMALPLTGSPDDATLTCLSTVKL